MRKNWKKVLSLLLAIAMVFSMNTTAFASGDISASEDNGSTVTEAVPEETPAVEEAAAEAAVPEDEIVPVGDVITHEVTVTITGPGTSATITYKDGEEREYTNEPVVSGEPMSVSNNTNATITVHVEDGYVAKYTGNGQEDKSVAEGGTIVIAAINANVPIAITSAVDVAETTLTWDEEKVHQVDIQYISENLVETTSNNVASGVVIPSQATKPISMNIVTNLGWKVKTPLPANWTYDAEKAFQYEYSGAGTNTKFAAEAFEADMGTVALSWNKGEVNKVELTYINSVPEQDTLDYDWDSAAIKKPVGFQKGTTISLNVVSANKYHVTGYKINGDPVAHEDGFFEFSTAEDKVVISVNTAENDAPAATSITPAEQNAYNSATFVVGATVAGAKYLVVSHNTAQDVIDKIANDSGWTDLEAGTVIAKKAISVNSDGSVTTAIDSLEQETVYDVLLAFFDDSHKIDSSVTVVALKPTGTKGSNTTPTGWTVSGANLYSTVNGKVWIIESTGEVLLTATGACDKGVTLDVTNGGNAVKISANNAYYALALGTDPGHSRIAKSAAEGAEVAIGPTGVTLYTVDKTAKSIPDFKGEPMVTVSGAIFTTSVNTIGDSGQEFVLADEGTFDGKAMADTDEAVEILVATKNSVDIYKLPKRIDEAGNDTAAVVKKVKEAGFVESLSVNAKVSYNQYTLISGNAVVTPTEMPEVLGEIKGGANGAAKGTNFKFEGLNPDYTYYLAVRAVSENYFSADWAIKDVAGVKPFRKAPTELKSVTVSEGSIRTKSFILTVSQQAAEKDIKYLVVSENSNADKALAEGKYVGRATDLQWKNTADNDDKVTQAAVSGNEKAAPVMEDLVPGTNYVVYAVYVDGGEFNSLPFKTDIKVTTETVRKAVATLAVDPAKAEYAGKGKKVKDVFKFSETYADTNSKTLSSDIIDGAVAYVILSGNSTEDQFKANAGATVTANPKHWSVGDDFNDIPVGTYKVKAYMSVKDDVDYIENKSLSSNIVDFEITAAPITPTVSASQIYFKTGNGNKPGYLYKTGDEYTIVEKTGKLELAAIEGVLVGRKGEDGLDEVSLPGTKTFVVTQGNKIGYLKAGDKEVFNVSDNAVDSKIVVTLSANTDRLVGSQSENYAKQEKKSLTINVTKEAAPTIAASGKDLSLAYLQGDHVGEEFVRDVYEFVTVKKDGEDVTKKNPTIKVSLSSNKDWVDVTKDTVDDVKAKFASSKVGDTVYLSANYVGINSEAPAAELTIKASNVAIVPTASLSAKAKQKGYSTSYNGTIDIYALTVSGNKFQTAEQKNVAIKDWTTVSSGILMIKDQNDLKMRINANHSKYATQELDLQDLTIIQTGTASKNYVIQNPTKVKYNIQPVMDAYVKLASAKAASANVVVKEGLSRNAASLKVEVALKDIPGGSAVSADKIYRDISWYAYLKDENGVESQKYVLKFKEGASDNQVTYDAAGKKFSIDLAKALSLDDKYIATLANATIYVNVIERAKQPYDVEKSDTKLTILPMNTVVYNGMQHVSTHADLKKNQVGDLEVVITSGDTELVEGVDYKVTYKNNVDAGSYDAAAKENKAPKVIVNGLGQYKGMYFEQYFIIEPAELDQITVTGLQTYYKLNGNNQYTPKFTGQLGSKKINAKNLKAKFGDDGTENKSGTKLTGTPGSKVTVTFITDDPNYVEGSTFDYTFNDGTTFEAILVPKDAKKVAVKLDKNKVNYSADGIEASAFSPKVTVKNGSSTVELEAGTDYDADLYTKIGKEYNKMDGPVKNSGTYYVGIRPTEDTILGKSSKAEGVFVEDVITYKAVKIVGKNFTSAEKKGFTTKYDGKAASTKNGQHIAVVDPAKGYDIELTAPKLDNAVGYIAYDVTGKNVVDAGEVDENGTTIVASQYDEYNRTPGTYKIDIFGMGAYNETTKVTVKYTVDPIPADKVKVLVYDDDGKTDGKNVKFNVGGYVYNEAETNSDFGQVKLGLKVGDNEDEYLTSLLKGAKVNITGSKIGDGKITITNVKANGKAVIKGTVKADIKIVKNDLSGSTSANANAGNKGIKMVDTGITAKKMNGNAQKGENFLKLYQASAKLGIDSEGNFKTKALTKNKHYTFKGGESFATKGDRTATFTGKEFFENSRDEDITIAEDMYTANKDLKQIKVNGGQPVSKTKDNFDAPVYPDVTVGNYTLTWNGSEYALKGDTALSGYEIIVTPMDNIFVGNKASVTVTFVPVGEGYSYTGSKTVKFKIKAEK